MPISTFFCLRATEASLGPLKNTVEKLKLATDTLESIRSNARSNIHFTELNEIGDDKNLNDEDSFHVDCIPKNVTSILVRSEVASLGPFVISWGELPKKLEELYKYLKNNSNSYYHNYLAKIAKKSEAMVHKMEAYFEETYEEQKKIKLAEAKAAINDFHSAFKLSQMRNMILAGFVFAIMGAILILFAGPLGIPAVVAGYKTGAIGTVISAGGGSMIVSAGLRNVFFGGTANLKKLADQSRQAAEDLLPVDERGIYAWLSNLLSSSDLQGSYWDRIQTSHLECEKRVL